MSQIIKDNQNGASKAVRKQSGRFTKKQAEGELPPVPLRADLVIINNGVKSFNTRFPNPEGVDFLVENGLDMVATLGFKSIEQAKTVEFKSVIHAIRALVRPSDKLFARQLGIHVAQRELAYEKALVKALKYIKESNMFIANIRTGADGRIMHDLESIGAFSNFPRP